MTRVFSRRTGATPFSLVGLLLILSVVLFPIFWVVLTSFQREVDTIQWPPRLLFTPTLINYRKILAIGLVSGLKNSLVVACITTAITFLLGSPFAYLIARHSFRYRENIRFWILTLRVMPPIVVIVPFIFLWFKLGLLDTYLALVVTYLTLSLPLFVWLSVECFRSIPEEVEEAAFLEGCSLGRVFVNISIPLALPGLISVLFFTFIFIWNEFFFAFALTSQLQTLPLVVAAQAQSVYAVPWGTTSAFTVILSIPPVVLLSSLVRFLAKYFIIS